MNEEGLPSGSVRKAWERLRANDAVWLGYHLLGKASARLSANLTRRAGARERAKDLPGVNSRDYNRVKWSGYDWAQAGEEWSPSPAWRQSVVNDIMLPAMPAHPDTLELGPGGGRWSVDLQRVSSRLVLADISERAIQLCEQRLHGCDNVSYLLTDGRSVTGVPDASIDFVWSFDAFVHIAPVDQKGYLRELARVMRPGATGVIHHAGAGGNDKGWRSSMTADLFATLLRDNGLRPIRQFERWGEGGEFTLTEPGDVITVFAQPVERDRTPARSVAPRARASRGLRGGVASRLNAALARTTGMRVSRVDDELPADYTDEAIRIIGEVQAYTMTSAERINALITATRYIVTNDVPGAIVECGVWRGGSMQAVAKTLLAAGDIDRDLYLFDTFEGMPEPADVDRRIVDGSSASRLLRTASKSDTVWAIAGLDEVRTAFRRVGYPDERTHYVVGRVEETVPEQAPEQIAILRLDTDWYASTRHELEHLFPRLATGGVLIIDDYGWWDGSRKAVDEYLEETGTRLLLVRADSGRIAVKL